MPIWAYAFGEELFKDWGTGGMDSVYLDAGSIRPRNKYKSSILYSFSAKGDEAYTLS